MSTTSGDSFRFGDGEILNKDWGDSAFAELLEHPYFVDKSLILEELFPLIDNVGRQYVCVTRPRRFGKSLAAEMIASFFGKNDTSALFEKLKIASRPGYAEHLNQHNVIHLSMIDLSTSTTYQEFIDRLSDLVIEDLTAAYPDVPCEDYFGIHSYLQDIYYQTGDRFIFVIDEWEAPLRNFESVKDKALYLDFFRTLLKDKPYVELAYFTGVLPIANSDREPALYVFDEYTVADDYRFDGFFGFTHEEVDSLYDIYLTRTPEPRFTREDLTWWYEGYSSYRAGKLYNPWSVIHALYGNRLRTYWTNVGPNDEIFHLMRDNVEGMRDDVERLIAGETVPEFIDPFYVRDGVFDARKRTLSAMVVYGLLTSAAGGVRIPNNEIRQKFISIVGEHPEFGPLHDRIELSRELRSTISRGESDRVAEIIQTFHDDQSTALRFNNDTDLADFLDWALCGVQSTHRVSREQPAGVGIADMLVLPTTEFGRDCLIIEYAIDGDPQEAIERIKQRQYKKYIESQPKYTGSIFAVGISYQRSDPNKTHHCAIEALREVQEPNFLIRYGRFSPSHLTGL